MSGISRQRLVLIAAIALAHAGCQRPPDNANKLPFVIEPASLDLGALASSPEGVPFSFEIRNVADAPLTLVRVRAPCDCVQLDNPQLEGVTIAPRSRQLLTGTFVTQGLRGRDTRAIVICPDSGGCVAAELRFEVIPRIKVIPENVELSLEGGSPPPATAEAYVTVLDPADPPLLAEHAGWLRPELVPVSPDRWRLRVQVDAAQRPTGLSLGKVTLRSSDDAAALEVRLLRTTVRGGTILPLAVGEIGEIALPAGIAVVNVTPAEECVVVQEISDRHIRIQLVAAPDGGPLVPVHVVTEDGERWTDFVDWTGKYSQGE